MGLRGSVRERIGRVGGDVQVWSSPGSGTSVMMSVPYTRRDTATGTDGAHTGGARSGGVRASGAASFAVTGESDRGSTR
jgi:hypothetical protein